VRSIKRHCVFDSSDFVLSMHDVTLIATYISVFQSGFHVLKFRETLTKVWAFLKLSAMYL